jgi:hypothetical protein
MTTIVRNILKVFRLATTGEVYNGTTWYGSAQYEATNIAYAHDLPLRIVVGVIAALSPNNKWERNISNASDMIAVFLGGGTVEMCKPSTYLTMRDKAWSILEQMPADDAAVIKVLNGQKITSFFRNIMGHDTCTVDGHAFNIANGKRIGLTEPEVNITKGQYKELQDAYKRAGKRVGLKAFEIQAITWVVWKRIHNI